MENLANVYAKMRRDYSENYSLKYAAAPTYLKQIVGPAEAGGKIVFLYEEGRNGAKLLNFASPTKLDYLIKGSTDLDVTGSPLKDECIVDAIGDVSIDLNLIAINNPWSLEEECHKGITIDKARTITAASGFNRPHTDSRSVLGSIWILCNAKDIEKTLLFQYEFLRGFNSRGLVTFEGVMPTHAINAQLLLQRHYSSFRAASKVETTIENTYHIKSNVLVKCFWTTAAALPSLIDLSACDVILRQQFCVADCGPATEEFMNQLRILMFIRDDIMAYKQEHEQDNGTAVPIYSKTLEPIYRCGRGIDIEDVRESVNKVMTEISGFSELDDGVLSTDDIEAVVQRAKLRRLTDITDKLWNILKCCSSYKDLKLAFHIVFQCAAKCNLVNTPTNKNRLAEIITEVANRRLAIPRLSGSEPLELLLEIGLEKLYKDYEFIFAESKICSANDLKKKKATKDVQENEAPLNVRKSIRNAMRSENITSTRKTFLHSNTKTTTKFNNGDVVSFKNSNFSASETSDQLAKLLQLHCTLEHLLMIQINLNLSNVYADVCDQLLKKPARVINSIDDTLVDEMEITLSAHDVREHLDGKDPHARRIIFKSENKFRHVKTTFFYSMENIFPPSISEGFHTEEDNFKVCVKNNLYYCWLYRKLKTVCPTNAAT